MYRAIFSQAHLVALLAKNHKTGSKKEPEIQKKTKEGTK
jgi:hypothetical protein